MAILAQYKRILFPFLFLGFSGKSESKRKSFPSTRKGESSKQSKRKISINSAICHCCVCDIPSFGIFYYNFQNVQDLKFDNEITKFEDHKSLGVCEGQTSQTVLREV